MSKVRSIDADGTNIGVHLEDKFWEALLEIAADRGVSAASLVRELKSKQAISNFSSEVRTFILKHFMERASL